ncbi:protein of unknown function [Methylorubrum extorquens DM4]|uniref:Uncharacterized protein n=1 Tax=Methylorubrum extorquens (strain DSM 6343 / CIP 106787 / DM4) TaxID=661410 RepID=C7CLI4_METED|nr:protein of unknown function [Methylorubrum extorquens DM4]
MPSRFRRGSGSGDDPQIGFHGLTLGPNLFTVDLAALF